MVISPTNLIINICFKYHHSELFLAFLNHTVCTGIFFSKVNFNCLQFFSFNYSVCVNETLFQTEAYILPKLPAGAQ